MMIDVLG